MKTTLNLQGTLQDLLKSAYAPGIFAASFSSRQSDRIDYTFREDVLSANVFYDRETGSLKDIKASIDYAPASEKLLQPNEILRLAEDFGGENQVRFMLASRTVSSFDMAFDISFEEGKMGSGVRRQVPYHAGLQRALDCIRAQYALNGQFLDIAEKQDCLQLTPSIIEQAYTALLETGLYPSLSNGGKERSFSIFQFPWDEGKMNCSLHLSWNDSDNAAISPERIMLMEETLRRNGFSVPGKTYRYTSERPEGWEAFCLGP